MPDQPFGLSTIGQILVPVRDAEAAAAFYRDRLGMRFLFAYPGMAFLDADGVRLYLAEPEDPEFGGRATLYFRVPDIATAVEAGQISGADTCVWHRGNVLQVNEIGHRDLQAKLPMQRDTIFRIASMTKPVTVAAAMSLVEEGKLALSDPVARWLPELAAADRDVLVAAATLYESGRRSAGTPGGAATTGGDNWRRAARRAMTGHR